MTDSSSRSFLNRVFTATSTDASRALYDDWAETYDSDMSDHEFTAPLLVAEALVRVLKSNHQPDHQEATTRVKILEKR
jgi:hypothetical protein